LRNRLTVAGFRLRSQQAQVTIEPMGRELEEPEAAQRELQQLRDQLAAADYEVIDIDANVARIPARQSALETVAGVPVLSSFPHIVARPWPIAQRDRLVTFPLVEVTHEARAGREARVQGICRRRPQIESIA
jgi:hypothetical protein